MFDPVMVRCEAMLHTPQDSLGPTADVDLAVDGADVRLHGVRAEVCQRRDPGIALALRNEGQDLRLSVAEPFASAGPIEPNGAAGPRGDIAYDPLSGMHCLQCGYQLSRRQCLRYIAVHSLLLGTENKVGVKVPGVDHDSACARIGDQCGNLLVIRFRLREGVVQNDVDGVLDSLVGVELGRFHLQQRITDTVNGSGGSVLNEVVSAGTAVFGVLADSLIVIVLTVYFLVDMPRIRTTLYRLVPHTRRPRAILIGDEVFAKVGAYVLGNVLISVITGAATFIWLTAFGVPYPLLLGIFVALLDLVPVVGSTIAGVVVAAVALTVSLPVCVATIAFFVAFRLLEDYLLVPRIIGRVVKVPALITVVAVLIGGALLGIVGALVAIPIAAALQLLTQEVLYPRLDEV
jgi:hypothetical protein